MWLTTNIYLVFVPIPDSELSTPCKFLSDKSAGGIFCSNEGTLSGLLGGSWIRLISTKTTPWCEAWNFQPHHPISRKRWGARNGVCKWSCPSEEASIKIPKLQSWEGFQVGKHLEVLGRCRTQRGHGSPSPHTCLTCPFHPDVHLDPSSHSFITNW